MIAIFVLTINTYYMAGITFNFELNNKPNKDSTYSIYLRITQNKKHKRIKMDIALKRLEDFNKKAKAGNWIRTSEPNATKWNDELERELEKVKSTYRDLKSSGLASKEKIVSVVTTNWVTPSFIEYAEIRTKEIFNEGSYRNYKKYNGFCRKLRAFVGIGNDLLFNELTPALLSKFESYLYTLRNERNKESKLHPNTIAVNLKVFKALINRAIEIDGLIKPENNPFMTFKYKTINTQKDKLNESEIGLIENLQLEKYSPLWHCRNYFLFSFYMAGIRAGDLIQLRWLNVTSEGRLEYEMGKNHKYRDIKIHQKAKDILQYYYDDNMKHTDYIFPLLDNNSLYAKAITQEQKDTLQPELKVKLFNQISSKNALINKYLKQLAKLAGIEKNISFHVARHSFAKVAKDKKTDNNVLKNLFAHSSVKITEGYMGDFDTAENDRALEAIFNENQDSKARLLKLLERMNTEEIETILNQIKQ